MTNFVSQPAPPSWGGSGNWSSITFGNGVFVAVAYGAAYAATSTDGLTWTQRNLPVTANWSDVAFGGGVFVAVAYGSNTAATSPDGVTWTGRSLPSVANWETVAYGAGVFVTAAAGSNKAAYSSNGSSWTARTIPLSGAWRDIAFGGGRFVLVAGSNQPYSMTSTDGITWVRAGDLPSDAGRRPIAYGNGLFVVLTGLSNGATVLSYSVDALVWASSTVEPIGTYRSWRDFEFGSGEFLALATTYCAVTTTGEDWSAVVIPPASPWYGLASDNDKLFVALGGGGFGGYAALRNTTPPTPPIFWTVLVNTSETP